MLAPKKDRTRAQILNAAQALFLEKGGLTFNFRDISYKAEMAIGTVYNYYKDLDAVHLDMVRILIGSYHKVIDEIVNDLTDPIEIIIVSTQQTLFCAAPGSSLGRLLFDEGLPNDEMTNSIKQRFMHDISLGVQAAHLKIQRPDIMLSMATGAMYSAMKDIYHKTLDSKDIHIITQVFFRLLGIEERQIEIYFDKPYKLKAHQGGTLFFHFVLAHQKQLHFDILHLKYCAPTEQY